MTRMERISSGLAEALGGGGGYGGGVAFGDDAGEGVGVFEDVAVLDEPLDEEAGVGCGEVELHGTVGEGGEGLVEGDEGSSGTSC